jgi:S-DNA-T family DNA segregation ATPase FtsK/SpoIIIE
LFDVSRETLQEVRMETAINEQMAERMAHIEQLILFTYQANNLYAYRVRGVQGPHTLSYALRLHEPTAPKLAKALKLGPALEAALGDGPVRLYQERGVLWVEAPSPVPVKFPGASLYGVGLAVPLGMGTRRTIIGLDFGETPHLLIVAPTGAGKTTAMRAIAFHLARQNERIAFIFLSLKPADWQAFQGLAATAAILFDPAEVVAMLGWLVQTMSQRAKRNQAEPAIFLFADDLLNWLSLADITGPLAQLASLGRSAGIHLVVATQRLGKRGAGDAAITGNMGSRLVLGAASGQDAAQFSGRADSGAHLLGRHKGDALLVENERIQRLAVSPIRDGDLAELAQDAREWRPWREDSGKVVSGNIPPAPVMVPPPGAKAAKHRQHQPQVSDEQIRAAYRRLRSKNKVAQELFGYKDGWVWGRITEALAGGKK